MPLSPDAAIVVMRLMGGRKARKAFDIADTSPTEEGLRRLGDLVIEDANFPWYSKLSLDRRRHAWEMELRPSLWKKGRTKWFWILRDKLKAAVLKEDGLDEYLGPLACHRVGLTVLGIGSPESKDRKDNLLDLHAHLGASIPFDEFWWRWLTGHGNQEELSCRIPEEGREELWKVVSKALDILKNNGHKDLDATVSTDDEHDQAVERARAADEAILSSKTSIAARRYIQFRVSALRALQFQRGEGGLNEFADRAHQWKVGITDIPGGGQFQARRWETRRARAAARRGGCIYVEYRVFFPKDIVGLHLLRLLLNCLREEGTDDPSTTKVRWILAHRREPGDGRRKAEWAVTTTRKLLDLLRGDDALREVVCGVDICGKERGTRLDPFRGAYWLVNEHNNEAARKGWPRLGKAVHVGEDFDSIVSGLRYIDEALGVPGVKGSGLHLRPGDRLGHCTALGLDPKKLRGRTYQVPLLTRLRDLAWMHHVASMGLATLRCEDLDREIRELVASTIAFRARSGELVRALIGNPAALALPADALGDASVPHVIDEVVVDRLTDLQRYLRRRVRCARLTVESCPTSNLVISELPDYRAVPFWRLARNGVPCTINTDDAGVLGIDLAHEVRSLERAGDGSLVDKARDESRKAAFRQPD